MEYDKGTKVESRIKERERERYRDRFNNIKIKIYLVLETETGTGNVKKKGIETMKRIEKEPETLKEIEMGIEDEIEEIVRKKIGIEDREFLFLKKIIYKKAM